VSQLTTSVLAEIGPDEDGTAERDAKTPSSNVATTTTTPAVPVQGKGAPNGSLSAGVPHGGTTVDPHHLSTQPAPHATTHPHDELNGFSGIDLTHASSSSDTNSTTAGGQPIMGTATAGPVTTIDGTGGSSSGASAAEWKDAFEKQQIRYKSELARLRDAVTHSETQSQTQVMEFRRLLTEKEVISRTSLFRLRVCSYLMDRACAYRIADGSETVTIRITDRVCSRSRCCSCC
jgi:hypothetical protein